MFGNIDQAVFGYMFGNIDQACNSCCLHRRCAWPCRSCLEIANSPEHGIRHIAFPAISCGVYGYPLDEAAKVALDLCASNSGSLSSITFVLFSEATAQPFRDYADVLFRSGAVTEGSRE